MTRKRPFRFGVAVEGAASREQWIAKARKVEGLGYNTLLVPDHFVTEFPPAVALMAAADATSTLRIGSYVFDNDFRHPTLLAKEAATLDVLSGGRFELGIGGGWMPSEYKQAGIMFDPPGTRLDRLEEAISIIKRLFADGPVTFSGNHYTVTGLEGIPKPLQRPHPPLFIDGGGKRLLSLAAREANIVGLHFKVNIAGVTNVAERSAAALIQKVEWVRQAAGKRFDELELNMLVSAVMITKDWRWAAEQFIREREWTGVTPEQVLDMPRVLIGSVDQIVEKLHMWREWYGISYIVVYDEDADMFAPVVARLAGK